MAELTEEARKARNAYVNEWRRKNKDKVAAYNKRHWERVASKTTSEEKKGNENE